MDQLITNLHSTHSDGMDIFRYLERKRQGLHGIVNTKASASKNGLSFFFFFFMLNSNIFIFSVSQIY
jgi:hypothetical protein